MILTKRFSTFEGLMGKKDWTGALTVLEKSRQKVEGKVLEGLMAKFYTNNKSGEAYRLLNLMPALGKEPNEFDYTLAIEVCIQTNKLIQALNVFYQSQVFGVSLDASLYSNLLSACTKDTGSRNIKWILACTARDEVLVSINSCLSVIKIGIMNNDYSLIEAALKIMHKSKYEVPSKLINSFIGKNNSESKDAEMLRRTWGDMNLEPIGEAEKEKGIRILVKDERDPNMKVPYAFELIMMAKEEKRSADSSNEDSSE